MNDRPACTECEFCKMKIENGAKGWEAYCTAGPRNKLIMIQYGGRLGWTKQELIDRMNARICPGWCPMWKRGEKNGSVG